MPPRISQALHAEIPREQEGIPIDLTTFTAIALLTGLIVTVQNAIRYARATDWNGMLGIALAWVGGLIVVELAAHASVTAALVMIHGAPSLGNLDGGSLVLLGLAVGSAAPTVIDFRKALDNTTSAEKPSLVSGAGGGPADPEVP